MFIETKIDKQYSIFYPWTYPQCFQFACSFRINSDTFWAICYSTYQHSNLNSCCYCFWTSRWPFFSQGLVQSYYCTVLYKNIFEFGKFFIKYIILFQCKLFNNMSYTESQKFAKFRSESHIPTAVGQFFLRFSFILPLHIRKISWKMCAETKDKNP